MRPYRAVFFDLGGTLFSYRTVQRRIGRTLFDAVQRLGVEADRRTIGKAWAEASRHAFARVAREDFYLHREVFVEAYRGFAERLSGSVPDDAFCDWLYRAQRERMIEAMELRDDCLDTLRALREEGLSLSIVSNIDDDHLHPMVERSGLDSALDHWTSSEKAGSCKPHGAFFAYCAELAGVEAREVLFVGDSPFHDVGGAKGAGMSAALIVEEGVSAPGQAGDASPEPDYEITQLSELLPIVRPSSRS